MGTILQPPNEFPIVFFLILLILSQLGSFTADSAIFVTECYIRGNHLSVKEFFKICLQIKPTDIQEEN